jgi:hypothetical protein
MSYSLDDLILMRNHTTCFLDRIFGLFEDIRGSVGWERDNDALLLRDSGNGGDKEECCKEQGDELVEILHVDVCYCLLLVLWTWREFLEVTQNGNAGGSMYDVECHVRGVGSRMGAWLGSGPCDSSRAAKGYRILPLYIFLSSSTNTTATVSSSGRLRHSFPAS